MAHELKKLPGDILGWDPPFTYLEYQCIGVWLGNEWNRPSRSDFYLMGIAHEVRTSTGRGPTGMVGLKDVYGVKFSDEPSQTKKTQEELDLENGRLAEAVWCAAFGLKIDQFTE